MKKIIFLLLLSIFSIQSNLAQEPEWLKKMKSINLLTSTREDMIKLFGQPKKTGVNYVEYFLIKGGRISVTYSRGKCLTQIVNGKRVMLDWNIKQGNVISVGFSPNKLLKPEELDIDFSGFQRVTPLKNFPTVTHYENASLGIDYTLHRDRVELIRFTPPKSNEYLKCNP